MKDLMLDLETLGTRPTSVIIQLGACYFDRNTDETGLPNIGDTFLVNICIGSSLMQGLTVDKQTIDWWREQKSKTWLVDSPNDINEALEKFQKFISIKVDAVWSHATFDFPILVNAFQACNLKLPFHYRTARDIRTLVDLSGLDYNKEKKDKTHDALEDCIYQVQYCVDCFKKLEKK